MQWPLKIAIAGLSAAGVAAAALAGRAGVEAAAPGEESGAGQVGRLTLYVENDSMSAAHRTDRYYTSGVTVDYAWQPEWIREFAETLALGGEFVPERTAFGVSATHMTFTPWRYGREEQPPNDHPYAGYVYLSFYAQRAEAAPDRAWVPSTFDHAQLDLGVVGPSALGEQLQNGLHDITGAPEVEGWDNQLHDEPAIELRLRRRVLLPMNDAADAVQFQLLPEIGLDVGTTLRQALGAVTLRFGQNLPDSYGVGQVGLPGSAVGGMPERGFGWEVFARLEGRLVQHNLFLDGSTWRDSPSVDREPVVGLAQIGGALTFGRHVRIGYSQFVETESFDGQDGAHSWGSAFVACCFSF